MWTTAPRAAKRLSSCPMAQTSPSTSALCAAAGLSPSTALSAGGWWRRPLIVCGTHGRQFPSMALRGPRPLVVVVAALPAAALTTRRWW
jgi:hypothetical protein